MKLSIETFLLFLPLLATMAIVIGGLMLLNWGLRKRYRNKPDKSFRFQMTMLLLTLVGILAIIIALPINETLQAQLLSLIGIILSGALALSSTTFIGNMLAGIMLKVIRSARPGDFITIGELTGRITEMDLLHVEVQTEFRDLVTVPNLQMVTQPLKVVRASGTIITAEVSLGYDIPHTRVSELLCQAAVEAGLTDAFTHVRELGDFSVTYRIAGLLEDVQSLISARARLRARVLDVLHGNGVEIVSPTFMNTRQLAPDYRAIPEVVSEPQHVEQNSAEAVAFDKAEEAASVEEVRRAIEKVDKELEKDGADEATRERLKKRKEWLNERLEAAEAERAAKKEY